MLRCVTCYFNITNADSIKQNYIKFRKNFSLPLTTVELAFDNQEFWIDDSIKIRGNASNIMWQKERLLNIAIQSLPHNTDIIAWLDADIIFHDDSWVTKATKSIDNYPVVQLFSHVFETGDDVVHNGLGYVYASRQQENSIISNSIDNTNIRKGGGTGLCWALRSDIVDMGLDDKSIVGVSDLHQLIFWEGDWDNHYIQILPPKYRISALKNGFMHYLKVQGNIGYIDSTIEHLHHGTFKNREYYHKQKILIDHDFDPNNDIVIDNNGLWKWNSDKFNLHQDIHNMFFNRKE